MADTIRKECWFVGEVEFIEATVKNNRLVERAVAACSGALCSSLVTTFSDENPPHKVFARGLRYVVEIPVGKERMFYRTCGFKLS